MAIYVDTTRAEDGSSNMQDWPLAPETIAHELAINVEAVDSMVRVYDKGKLISIQIIFDPDEQ